MQCNAAKKHEEQIMTVVQFFRGHIYSKCVAQCI